MLCRAHSSARYVSTKNPRSSAMTRGSRMRTAGSSVSTNRTSGLGTDDPEEILPIGAGPHGSGQLQQVRWRNVSHPECNLLDAGHHQSLSVLDGLDEVGRLHQRLVRSGVEPRDAARQLL